MKTSFTLRAAWAAFGLFIGLAAGLSAEEPYLEFVTGLRSRGYYDFAEQYLRDLQQDGRVPADVKAVVAYELGVTIRDSARALLIPEEQRQRLDEAQAAFEQFAKAAPQHELAGRANSERAKILVEKARVDLWDADGTSESAKKQQLRESARKYVGMSREIYATAAEQLKKNFESFPGFIPQEEREKIQQREAAEAEYIQAQLNLAETTYWDAQTYDHADAKRKEALSTAMEEFEKIHTAYRSMIGGLLARLWQGKCLEEIGQKEGIDAALGIYGELLRHDGSSTSMLALQSKAQQFQLICYNHDTKKEYRLINQLATEWLKSEANRRLKATETGKGIEWEQARALEKLGDERTVPENERTTYLNQALNIARGLARRAGPHKAPAAGMVARISTKLGRDSNDPTDFNSAYGRADELFNQAQEITKQISAAVAAKKSTEAQSHAEARKGVAAELTRMLGLALQLADKSSEQALVRRSELLLAVSYLWQERSYEATAVSEYFLRNHSNAQPDMLSLAGNIAITSLQDAYLRAPKEDREFEKEHTLALAAMVSTRWPNSDLADKANLNVGGLLFDGGDYDGAAQAWLKIPNSSKTYGVAQLKAGSAFFELYTRKAHLEASERPPAEQLAQWLADAEKYLQQGVDLEAKATPAESENRDLLLGKLALAQVRNRIGVYKTQGAKLGSIELITAEPHALTKAVQTPPGETRPDDPGSIKGRQMASLVYQELLRAQIGAKDIDAARDARTKLEEVGAGGDTAALTQIFVQFGRQLQDELEQLKASGANDRLKEVRDGFEAFLSDLYDREDAQQTFNSLLWIAETYASLGESAEDDLIKSQDYFNRSANAYDRIITRGATDPAFLVSPSNGPIVRIRMLECRLRQKDYEAAEKVLFEVLKESPSNPGTQQSGARLYQEWAEMGDSSKLQYALNGRKEPVVLWGWGELANKMRGQVGNADLQQLYYEATYRYAQSYHQQAAKQSGDDRKKSLENALLVFDTFTRTSRNVPQDVYDRMNTLYKSLLSDAGQADSDMPVPGSRSGGGSRKGEGDKGRREPPPPPPPQPEPEPPANTGNVIVVLGLLVLGGAAVFGIFAWTTSQSKKKRAAALAAIAASSPAPKKRKPATSARAPGKPPSEGE
jgi:hypothetical protein